MATFRNVRWVLAVALLGGACSSILGIEDLNDGPDPSDSEGGENGSGGSSSGQGGSTSGTSGTSGTAGKGGTSGTAGEGGTSGASGSTGTGGTSGEAGGGSGGDDTTGGTAGTAGMDGGNDPTVRGRIITTWNQPIPNVTVMIGDAEDDTNANGEFEIPDVTDTYDVKFVLNYQVYSQTHIYGWAYLGLTRRDPTLQVYNGIARRSGNVGAAPNDLTGTDFTNRKFVMALGGADGEHSREVTLPNGLGQGSASWQGPATMPVTAHGLLFEHDASSSEIPTVYRSYDQNLGQLSETDQANFAFSLPDETVASDTVAGMVTSPTNSDRTNYVYVRFESNAAMPLVEHYGSTLDADSFTYAVPSLTGGSIEIAALEGTYGFGPIAVAHRDRVALGQIDISLAIPTPPTLVAPGDGTTGVDNTDIFSWTSQAQTFVWHAENVATFDGMFVVTSEKRMTIPEFPNGFMLVGGARFDWTVETHGAFQSVDELAGPTGFIDAWAPYGDAIRSPRRGDGTFAQSSIHRFTTVP